MSGLLRAVPAPGESSSWMPEPTPPAVFELRPLRHAVRVVTLAALLLGVTLGVGQGVRALLAIAYVVIGSILGVVGSRRPRRRGSWSRAPIVVTRDVILVPTSMRARTVRPIPLERVTAVEERGRGTRGMVIIGTSGGDVVIPRKAFLDEAAGARLRQAVRDAIGARPDGLRQLAAMDEREAAGRLALERTRWATMGLLVAIGVAFVIERVNGAPADHPMVVRLGANAPILVHQGQWWRALTANFLHLSTLHLVVNAIALLSLGTMLERSVGSSRVLAVALIAGIAGSVASLTRSHGFSAGASAMIFGLAGGLLFVNVRHRAKLPAGVLIGARRWVTLLAINAAISLLPGIDGRAHAGGVVAGTVTMLVFARRLEMTKALATVCGGTVLFLGVLYTVGIAAAVAHVRSASVSATSEFVTSAVEAPDVGAPQLNDFAWAVAIDRTSSAELLIRAEEIARRAMSLEPANGAYIDTRAYLLHRLGRRDEALTMEREAAWTAPSPAVFTMLHRFFAETETESTATRVTRERDELSVTAPGHGGAVVYAAVARGGVAAGLLRLVLPAGAEAGQASAPDSLPNDATFEVLLVDAGPARAEIPAAYTQVAFRARDVTTVRLP